MCNTDYIENYIVRPRFTKALCRTEHTQTLLSDWEGFSNGQKHKPFGTVLVDDLLI